MFLMCEYVQETAARGVRDSNANVRVHMLYYIYDNDNIKRYVLIMCVAGRCIGYCESDMQSSHTNGVVTPVKCTAICVEHDVWQTIIQAVYN